MKESMAPLKKISKSLKNVTKLVLNLKNCKIDNEWLNALTKSLKNLEKIEDLQLGLVGY